jgi:hypothetical protein
LVAGTAATVEAFVKMLNKGNIPIPHLGIRDRDYLSADEVDALEDQIPNLFVWRRRSIENEMLHPPLIAMTLERPFHGRSITEEEVRAQLLEIANRQREHVDAELVEANLQRMHEYTKKGSTPLERSKHHLSEVHRVASEKLAVIDEVAETVREELDARWDKDFLELVDGKRLLNEYVEKTPFSSVHDLIAALIQTAHDDPELLPPGFVAVRERMHALFPAPASS